MHTLPDLRGAETLHAGADLRGRSLVADRPLFCCTGAGLPSPQPVLSYRAVRRRPPAGGLPFLPPDLS